MNIKLEQDRVTLHDGVVEQEMNDLGAVMSHVYYGRGFPIPDEETIANVVMSFRLAQRAYGTVYLVWDEEDTGFGGEGSSLERIFDQPIEDDCHALLTWWEAYGFASGEDAAPFQRKVAALVGVDYRMLTPAQ